LDSICCPLTFPLSYGSKWLLDGYRIAYTLGGAQRMLLISSCDLSIEKGGHGPGFFAEDNMNPEESTFKAIKTFLWWEPKKDFFAAQNAWHLMIYSKTPTANVEWDGSCNLCDYCD
jgi:hypothetical protein